jgi:hypothetical protein
MIINYSNVNYLLCSLIIISIFFHQHTNRPIKKINQLAFLSKVKYKEMTTTQRNGKANIKETGKNQRNGETKPTAKGLINGDKTGRQTAEQEGMVT